MIHIKDYYYWIKASRKELDDLKKLYSRFNALRNQMNRFNNISLGDAKRHRDIFDKEYAEMHKRLEECEDIFNTMKQLGKAMEHYATENRAIIHNKIRDMKVKYSRFTNIMEEEKRREKLIK
ncbi:MAG: hypothetical protein JSW73_02040 [Candidatus Woesearchaeota archaeon]|nr:MAG: hypothetical protein JSW73_02040 [Candidatus Woesearchaeota archaeon]